MFSPDRVSANDKEPQISLKAQVPTVPDDVKSPFGQAITVSAEIEEPEVKNILSPTLEEESQRQDSDKKSLSEVKTLGIEKVEDIEEPKLTPNISNPVARSRKQKAEDAAEQTRLA